MAEENKEIEQVVANASIKKQSEIKKFGKAIISEDANRVGTQLKNDVLIPGIKKLLTDIGTKFVDWIVNGVKGSSATNGRQVNGGVSRISYSDYYSTPTQTTNANRQISSAFYMDEILYDTRGDAEVVLLKLKEAIARYGMVSVSAIYEMCNLKCAFTAEKYGWRDLSNATISSKGDKYVINFPKIQPLE